MNVRESKAYVSARRGSHSLRMHARLLLALLSLSIAACTSVPRSTAGFVVLESNKFT